MSESVADGLAGKLEESHSDDSSTILNLTQYSPQTWMDLMSYGVPTVGMAFLLITHPLLFLASLPLVGMGGVYATMDGDCGRMFGVSPPATDTTIKESRTDITEKRAVPSTVVSVTSTQDEPQLCLTDEDSEEEQDRTDSTTVPPQLENSVLRTSFPGLHAKEFFEVFFGDDAPFSFRDFQERRGDINIEYGAWRQTKNDSKVKQRVLTFQTPTRTPMFGPSHASASKTQVLRTRQKHCVVFEAVTTLRDIPYSDRFCVKELWVLQSSPEKVVDLTVSSQAVFSKSCPFESQIRSKSLATMRETLASWAIMAKQALIISQRQREREAAAQKQRSFSEEIEVTYHQSKYACVVGEDDGEDADWELDPMAPPCRPSPTRASPKKAARKYFKAFRSSFSQRFSRPRSSPPENK